MGPFTVDERSSTGGTSRPRLERISGRRAFERLRLEGRRAHHGAVGITWVPGAGGPRVAYAVGRRVGSAVVRNRVRRRLRVLMSELATTLPAGDWLVGARPSAADRTMADLRGDVGDAVGQLVPDPPDAERRP